MRSRHAQTRRRESTLLTPGFQNVKKSIPSVERTPDYIQFSQRGSLMSAALGNPWSGFTLGVSKNMAIT